MNNLKEREQIFIDKVKRKFPNNNFLLEDFKGVRKPIKIICLECGKERILSRAEQVLNLKSICDCSLIKKTSQKNQELHLKINDYFNKNEKYLLIENFTKIGSKIKIKCQQCQTVQSRDPESFLKDDRCLCCEKKCVVKKSKFYFNQELEEKFQGEYLLVGDYKGTNLNTYFKHRDCGKVFLSKPHNLLTEHSSCPICNKSKGEKEISTFLENQNINHIPQYRLTNFKKAPYDFYLPDFNLLIEFQGRQHYEPVSKFGGEKQFIKQIEIDNRKKEIAEKEGIELLIISYLDLKNINSILIQRLFQTEVNPSGLKSSTSLKDDDIV